MNWWDRWPTRYAEEIDAFDKQGASISILHMQDGILLVEAKFDASILEGKAIRIGFSPSHPFMRPSVAAPGLELARHQNPATDHLCILTQEGDQWDPKEMVADLIAKQLDKVGASLSARAEGDLGAAASLEENAGDPISSYFRGKSESASYIAFDPAMPLPNNQWGFGDIILASRLLKGTPEPLQGVLQRCRPPNGPWFAPPFKVPKPQAKFQSVPALWVRLDIGPKQETAEILDLARNAIIGGAVIKGPLKDAMSILESKNFVLCVALKEEVAYNEFGTGWIFILVSKGSASRLISGQRISPDISARLPAANALKSKVAVIVGCGAIGSFVAIELARAGLRTLHLIDGDTLNNDNSVRWPLGRWFWGLPKVQALYWFLEMNYPWAEVHAYCNNVGATSTDVDSLKSANENPLVQLRGLIENADVIIDCTASREVQMALAFECRELKRPFIVTNATEGAIGGIVARFLPGTDACFNCLLHAWSNGEIEEPPFDESTNVVPVGCNMPTFTGGAFDLEELSLEVVRSAIGILADEYYDKGEWDVATLSFRDDGKRILPQWSGRDIPVSAACTGH